MKITPGENGRKTLLTGLVEFQVIAVNPTADELMTIYGRDDIKEPEYVKDTEQGSVTRVDIYCKEVGLMIDGRKPVITKHTSFISNELVSNKEKTKFNFINCYGQNSWAAKIEDIEVNNATKDQEWKKFSFDGIHKARKGELELIDFIANVYEVNRRKSDLSFENWGKMVLGNTKELKNILTDAIEREKTFFMLLGVKDGKYQDVFKTILPYRHTDNMISYFWKQVNDINYGFKSFFTEKPTVYQSATPPENIEEEAESPFGDTPEQTPLF